MSGAEILKQVNQAIGDHGMWKLRLRTAITTGRSDITARDACRDDKCSFGVWIHGGSIDPNTRAGMPYKVVKRLHAEFHQCAGAVLSNMEDGNATKAKEILDGEYIERTDKLVRALTKWKRELMSSSAIGNRAA